MVQRSGTVGILLAFGLSVAAPPVSGEPNAVGAELSIGQAAWSASLLAEGETLRVRVWVNNSGDAATPQFTLRLANAGVTLDETNLTLAPRAAGEANLSWISAAGNHVLNVTVDALGVVSEEDETDNWIEFPVNVTAASLPELGIGHMFTEPSSAALEGERVSVVAFVMNNGTVESGAFTVRFEGPRGTQDVAVGSLAAGGAKYVTGVLVAASGGQRFFAVADIFNDVDEAIDWDNSYSIDFYGNPRLPDLGIHIVDPLPRGVWEGDDVRYRLRVYNDGNAESPATFLRLSDSTSHEWIDSAIPALDPGEQFDVLFTWQETGPGSHVVTFEIDPYGDVADRNSWNNKATWSYYAKPAPDLAITVEAEKPTIETDVVIAGTNPLGPIVVRVTACNVAGSTLPYARARVVAETGIYATGDSSSELIGEFDVEDLRVGRCVERAFHWSVVGAVGDIDFVASGESSLYDPRLVNNVDRDEEFVLVGGAGGVIVEDL